MHITIASARRAGAEWLVEFRCKQGTGRGVWKAGTPRPGQGYFVEMNLPEPLSNGANFAVTTLKDCRIWISEDHVRLTAEVDEIFDEQTACLRMDGSLILIEYHGTLPTVGTYLEVIVPNLFLFDENL